MLFYNWKGSIHKHLSRLPFHGGRGSKRTSPSWYKVPLTGPRAIGTIREYCYLYSSNPTPPLPPPSALLTAGERLQASHSSVSGVQTGGHVGGWITPAVSDYEQDAQRRQLNIHSLSEIRSVKSLEAALVISRFTIWPAFARICPSVWRSSGNQTGVNSAGVFCRS